MSIDTSLDVPGTTVILNERGEAFDTGLKLVPEPSNDPEDPLNWSKSRKLLQLANIILYTAGGALVSSALFAILVPLSETTGLSLDQLNEGAGYSYLSIGLGALLFQPAALAIGKKPIYLFSAFVGVPLNIWTVYTRGNAQWVACRLLLGFTGAPVFTLGEISIADMYFYHERAWPLGCYVAVLYAAACLGPLVGGFIFERMGWKPTIYIISGIQAAISLFMLFTLEETDYRRAASPSTTQDNLQLSDFAADEGLDDTAKDTDKGISAQSTAAPVLTVDERVVGHWRGPRPLHFTPFRPHAGRIIWKGAVQSLAVCGSPLVIWCGFMYGLYQIFYNLIATISSGVLSYEPYNFSTSAVGLTFLSPMIATLPGAIFGGWLTDKYTIRQARANHGISEPEHKLKLFIFASVLSPIGLLMIGLGPYYELHYMVFVAGTFILNIAGPLATVLVIAYAFDCYHPIQPTEDDEVQRTVQGCAPYLLAIILIGMIFTFGFNYAITPWVFTWGLRNFAISSALVAVAMNATVVLVYKYGKRMRRSGERFYLRVIAI